MFTALMALEAEAGRKYVDEAIPRGSFLMEVFILVSILFEVQNLEGAWQNILNPDREN
jgi:hypothetical protein